MDKKRLEELCRLGERADGLLREGRPREALKGYEEITADLGQHGDADSYLMAKLTLGVLRCHVKLCDFKSAFKIWNASIDDSLYGIGIYALESAQTTVQDMITYDMICAFLHTLAEADKPEAASAVNQYLSRVCEHALDEGDRVTMKMALNNWKHHLREIFQGSIPHQYAHTLIEFERSLGETVKTQSIDFPMPTQWEKPQNFREMSRVVRLKEVNHPGSRARKQRAS